MGEKRRLRAALDAYKGKDVKAERQKKLRKQAEKKKRTKREDDIPGEEGRSDRAHEHVETNAVRKDDPVDGDGWETEESERAPATVSVNCSTHEGLYADYGYLYPSLTSYELMRPTVIVKLTPMILGLSMAICMQEEAMRTVREIYHCPTSKASMKKRNPTWYHTSD